MCQAGEGRWREKGDKVDCVDHREDLYSKGNGSIIPVFHLAHVYLLFSITEIGSFVYTQCFAVFPPILATLRGPHYFLRTDCWRWHGLVIYQALGPGCQEELACIFSNFEVLFPWSCGPANSPWFYIVTNQICGKKWLSLWCNIHFFSFQRRRTFSRSIQAVFPSGRLWSHR